MRAHSYVAAAFVTCFAVPAIAACPDDIGKVREELRTDRAFQDRYTAGSIDAGDYNRLLAAAETFGQNGMEDRCQAVLAGVRDMARQQSTAPAPGATTPGTATPAPRRDADRAATDRAAYLRNAQPMNSISGSIERVIGADVRNIEDRDLGDLSDLQFENGSLKSAIIGSGGFLGMGVSYYIVEPARLKIAADGETVVLDMSADQLAALPRVERGDNGQWAAAADTRRPDTRTAPQAPESQPRR